jgi:hypothetical protein
MLFVIHRYYTPRENSDELLALRLRLSAGLRSLGLTGGQLGRVLPGAYPPGTPVPAGPDVMAIWSVPTEAEAQRWIAQQLGSDAFRAVTVEQSEQVARYEREAYDIIDPAPGWLRLNRYYARPGMAEQVLETRRRGNAVMRQLEIPAGLTGTRNGPSQGESPEYAPPPVIWFATFADANEYQREATTATGARALQELLQGQPRLLTGCVVESYTIVAS